MIRQSPETAVSVFADDLSGAAETASAFLGRAVELSLNLDVATPPHNAGVLVADLNTRAMTARDAQHTLRTALAGVSRDGLVIKKIDSLLRGHIGAEVAILAERGPVIMAAALPTMNRIVVGGTLHVGGVPLHRTRAWAAEKTSPPPTVAALFGDLPSTMIPAGHDVADSLSRAASTGHVAVCDAATDADLELIVRASRSIPGAQLVGTSALAAAVARTLPVTDREPDIRRAAMAVLTVVGTAEPIAVAQVAALVAAGVQHVAVSADALLCGSADPAAVTRALERGSVVLTIAGAVDPATARALSAALGRFVAAGQAAHRPDLVLTGGETARAVVDAIGLTSLRPVHEVHHGAVVSVASDGRNIVTRPGSFGDAESLTAIAKYLTTPTPFHPPPGEGLS
jgi:4-hydroxythreonine-4-phosphate dehydrogenase